MTPEGQFTFNEVADQYERARPGYPDALFDDVVALTGISRGDRILEIGCGTGKATMGFASRGFRMVCLEPGAALADVARTKLAAFPAVDIIEDTFENWPVEHEAFDLAVCAQAFHWLAPEMRFEKSAAALRNRGFLAVFSNVQLLDTSPVRRALDGVYARLAPSIEKLPPARWHADDQAVRSAFDASGRFGPVTYRRYPWSHEFTADEYLDLLGTHSDHNLLPETQRNLLLIAVRQTIEEFGDKMTVSYQAHLYVAEKRGEAMS